MRRITKTVSCSLDEHGLRTAALDFALSNYEHPGRHLRPALDERMLIIEDPIRESCFAQGTDPHLALIEKGATLPLTFTANGWRYVIPGTSAVAYRLGSGAAAIQGSHRPWLAKPENAFVSGTDTTINSFLHAMEH